MAVLVPIFGGGGGPSTGGITVTIALTGQLNDLDDVVINNPQNGQLLSYNGFIWTNQALYMPSSSTISGMQSDIAGLDTRVQTVSSNLNSEIITRLNTDNFLQRQINEIASGYRLVFCEQFIGDGVSTSFQLAGAVTNAQIISGSWRTANIQNASPVNITDVNGKVIYDGGLASIFTRHRISVTGLNGSGLGSLDYPPQLGTSFKIWYWYELSSGDRVDNYYRDDFVASMEETDGKLAVAIAVDTSSFTTSLSSSDINAQLAFNRLDKHTHPNYATISSVAAISSGLLTFSYAASSNALAQATTLINTNSALDANQATQISALSGNDISVTTQISALSGNSISVASKISALSGNSISVATQISELSGRPVPDIFRAEVVDISAKFVNKQGDTVYGQILFQNGDMSFPPIAFESHINTGFFIDTTSSDSLSISTNGTKRLEITQDGGMQFGGVNGASPGNQVFQLGGLGITIPTLANIRLRIVDDIDNYLQTAMQNFSKGQTTSTDYVATNDIGDDFAYWVDFGINGSNYTSPEWTINGSNDAYMYTGPGPNFAIGTSDATAHLSLFAGGTLSENEQIRIFPNGGVQIGGPYDDSITPGSGNIRLINISGGVVNSILIHDGTGTIIDSEITINDILSLSQNSSANNIVILQLSGQNFLQSSQIIDISGTNISQASQIASISAAVISNSITLAMVSNASANAQIQTTNNLSSLIFSMSGNNISQASQITSLSANSASLTMVSNASANALAQATGLINVNTSLDANQAIQISALSGNSISVASQIAALSANTITFTQVYNASANAQIQTTNNLSTLIFAISGNNISQSSQITSLSARPIADIFRTEISSISSNLYTQIHTLSASDILYTPGTSAYWYKYPQPTNSLQATDDLGQSAYINRHAISKLSSTGLAVGGTIVSTTGILSGSSFSISGGFGYIIDQTLIDAQDPQGINPTVYTVQWNDITNISVTQNITAGYSATYVLIDKNGNYILTVDDPDSVDIRDNIFLGKVSHRFGAINSIRTYSRIPDEVYAQVSDISIVLGTININGNEYTPAATDLTLKKSSGSSFRFSSNAATTAKSPHISTDPSISVVSFRSAYRANSDGSIISYGSSNTSLSPSQWDNGSGVLQNISGGNWTIKRIYFFPITNSTYIFHGQAVYTTLAAAKDGISTENFKLSDSSFNSASLRAWVLVRDDATNLADINTAVFVNSGKFGGSAGGGGGIINSQFTDSSFYIYDDSVPTNKIKFNLDNMTSSGKTITLSAQSILADISLVLPIKSGVFALDSTIQAMSGSLYALIASSSGQGNSSSGGITGSYVSSVNGVSGNVNIVGGNGIAISSLSIAVTADYILKAEVNAISSALNGNNISQASQIASLSGNSISIASQIASLSASSGGSLTLVQVSNASANSQVQTTNNLSPLIFALSGNSISVASQISAISGNSISVASQIAALSSAANDVSPVQVANASANALAQATSLININTALDANQAIQIAQLSGNSISVASQITALSGRSIPDIFRIEVAAVSAGLNTRINDITGGGIATIIVAGPGITASQNGNTWTIGVTGGSTVSGSGSGYSGPYPDIFRIEVAAVSSNLQTQINNITIGGVNVNSSIIVMSGSQIVDRKDSKLFEYDGSGNLVGLTGSVGIKTFQYNGNGDLISISGSGLYQTKSFNYDSNGNLISVGVI